MPVLSNSLIRVPLGIWTDKLRQPHRHGGAARDHRAGDLADGYATQFWQFLVIGLVLGLAGGSFSVGALRRAVVPEERQGFAMGVFGAG